MNLHKDSKHVYSCYYCDFRTNSSILFTSHTRTHSSESTQFGAIHVKEEDFDDICQANATHPMVKHPDVAEKLDEHIIKTHPDFIASVSSKVHECTECTYKTTNNCHMKQHMVKHADVADNRITNRCIYCNKTFKGTRSLDNHVIRIHTNFIASVSSKVHECTECTYKTVFTRQLRRHMVNHPDVTGNHISNRCIHCNKTFKTKQKLDDHIIKKHPDFIAFVTSKVHECTECTYKTTDNSHLKQHMAKHPDVAGNHIPNRCIHCNKAFTTKKRLDDHIIKKHPDFISSVSSKVHECTECTYKTTDNSNLEQHMAKHPDIAGNHIPNRCIHCNKAFTTKKRLDDHIIKKHPDFISSVSSKVHECTECTYKTTDNSNLKQHMLKHPDIAGNHITNRCIHCNKTFTTKKRLDDHIMKKHPDFIASVTSKVHQCTECTYKTTNNSHLRRHMMAKHPNIAGNHITNRCIHCNKAFTTKKRLDDHIIKKHPDFIASVTSKVHQCTECTYKTTDNCHLKQHMAKHPNISGNHIITVCIHCNKTFTTKQKLDEHIVKTHPDFIASVSSKVHECTQCTYKTISNIDFKQHTSKHPDIAGKASSTCIYCNKTFASTRSLNDHIVKTYPDFIASVKSKIHECTQCTYKTTISKRIRGHLMAKHPEIAGNRRFRRCIYCNKTFTRKLALEDHVVKRHPDFIASVSKKIYQCSKCTFKTVSTKDLKRHIMARHPDIAGNRKFRRCIYCSKAFVRRETLDDHVIKTHPDFIASVSSRVHECTKCTFKTISSSQLRRHAVTHDIAGNRITIRCIYCNKIFTTKQRLDDHIIKAHPDFIASVSSKVHECTQCTYKTTDNSHLKQHMVKHADVADNHITNGCIYCNKTFKGTRSLDDHILRIHPDFIASVSSKVHECTECTYKTVFTGQLRRHMVNHSDLPGNHISNRCIHCNKIFTTKQRLDDHIIKMAKHSDIAGNRITIRCNYCNKTFTSTQALDDHILNSHPDFIVSVSSKIHECTKLIDSSNNYMLK
nr:unnamed protein product [Callosobruchus analis]